MVLLRELADLFCRQKEKMSQYCDLERKIYYFFVMARPLP